MATALPTVAEAGYPGFDVFLWVGFFAPAGTPRERLVGFLDCEDAMKIT